MESKAWLHGAARKEKGRFPLPECFTYQCLGRRNGWEKRKVPGDTAGISRTVPQTGAARSVPGCGVLYKVVSWVVLLKLLYFT